MAELMLTQAEADGLIAMRKRRIDDRIWQYRGLGGSVTVPLESIDGREDFLLDVHRARIDLVKGAYQNRARHVVVLVRLDFGGKPHLKPDGEEIASPHLHLYREGFGDKWAFPVPADRFPDILDAWLTLHDFMQFCNIVEQPTFSRGLFA
jgi:hypothetical protein